jgi:hypothetical protein
MAIGPPSDAVLVRYLLGEADRSDEERFDELSVIDAAFAERLRAIEHDLADAYVREELSSSDRERWEARYLASQHGRDDLALAETLAARETEVGGRRSEVGGRGSEGGGRRSEGGGRRFGGWWQLTAAAVLVLAVIGGYRIAHRQRPSATVARQPPVMTPAPAPAPATPAPVAHVVALTLMPSVRSIDATPTLEIPPGTTDVKLTLRLEPDARDRYNVALRDLTSNTIAWQADSVTATGSGADRALVISVPSSTFRQRRYLINVTAAAAGSTEIVATYPLIVVLQ